MKIVSKSYAVLCATVFVYAISARAQEYRFSGSLALDYAEHLQAPQTPASEKAFLKLQQTAKFDSKWSGVVEGQGWIEGVYSGGSGEYPAEAHDQDRYEARLQDTYLKYVSGPWDLRAGLQQQMWGETFGNYIADIVNPKDLRFGVPLDPSRATLATPMMSLKYIAGSYSLQGIWIPRPSFNILPLPGEDFFPAFPELSSLKHLQIVREHDLPASFGNAEFGGRLSGSFHSADVSLLAMNYFDRNPFYELGSMNASTQTLSLNERHARVTSTGLTFAVPIGESGYMLRGEGLYTMGRSVNALNRDYTLRHAEINDVAAAVSLELPAFQRSNIAFQFSESQWIDWAKYVTRSRQDVEYLSVRAAQGLFESSTWTSVLTWSMLDGGFRVQSDFSSPLSNRSEFAVGAEVYGGKPSSDFAQIQRASRVYALLRFFFHG